MIGITKLLTGKATVSAAMRSDAPAHLLQFSDRMRPVVVWNSTGRCNLDCTHCYAQDYRDGTACELSTAEAKAFIDDLAVMAVPVLLFSGGEPLMREDVYELADHARSRGLRTVLSTNGTLITGKLAERLADAGIAYVGVSLDGARATHDLFRNRSGAFDEAVAGLGAAKAAGLRTGVRFTLTARNFADLPAVLDLVEKEGFDRFCMYHLVYAGRGEAIAGEDVSRGQSRSAVETLIARASDWAARGIEAEILTADNHADGVLLLRHIESTRPERAEEVRRLLVMSGGCSAGQRIAAVDPAGNVYACQFWSREPLGNVRERTLSTIWRQPSAGLLDALRKGPGKMPGRSRCARCAYVSLCGGCRVRALAATGDLWGADPQCYLTDEEIGLQAG